MLQTTRGIVFHQIKYSETSIIVKIYTEQFGLQSFLVRGARKKNAKIKASQLQHLSLVELEVFRKESKDLQIIKELKVIFPFQSIPLDIRKSTILIFLNEVLYKVIKEEEPNPELFEYIQNVIQILDLKTSNFTTIHFLFLVHLTRFLGFFPKNNYSISNPNFDLKEGQFSSDIGPESFISVEPYSKYISMMCDTAFERIDEMKIPTVHKNNLLEIILNYYKHHIPGIIEFKSHAVLKSVFSN
ncbi:DNA repair protein RecO [Desulfosarcina sp.]|nr:DNA repair protein RecO [Desulfosarcina sp.]